MMDLKGRRSFFPVFLFSMLLFLYFLLHENNVNYGLIPISFIFELGLIYTGIIFIISLLSWFLFKSKEKAFLFTILIIAILLFFGAFHDTIKKWPLPAFFTRYSFILPFLLFLVIAALVFLKRTSRHFIHTTRYMRIILVILCLWETVGLTINMISGKGDSNILFSKHDRDASSFNNTVSTRPNIYFIVFDAFTSSECLKYEFGYDNTHLDSFLRQQGFYVVRHSKSNYPLTVYSIASTLNGSYLVPGVNNTSLTAQDLVKGKITVAHNRLIPFLERNGYAIYNYSGLNLPGHPAKGPMFLNNLEKRLSTLQTLWGRIKRDILWNVTSRNFKTGEIELEKGFIDGRTHFLKENITNRLTAFQQTISTHRSPAFVYCHLLTPHEPYIYNRDGSFAARETGRTLKQKYLEQLIYTNQMVQLVVKNVIEKDQSNKIIIIEGDHGFRDYGRPDKKSRFFDNLNALYFYDHNYKALHDSISPVNTFRVVLNQYLGQQLPYLKDTSIYVHDVGFDIGQGTVGH